MNNYEKMFFDNPRPGSKGLLNNSMRQSATASFDRPPSNYVSNQNQNYGQHPRDATIVSFAPE